ncbi:hypothetical protein DFS34DRAFT_633760 [Phlyctochytrium arcticum]|nr:hypothetical protein DFS34DRAFT_640842 [Phlyctochytrium arcticum]KAI9092106.1 hypothetical protein DFS34DRAFT_633760 [Phlyctochytrium arcticum]
MMTIPDIKTLSSTHRPYDGPVKSQSAPSSASNQRLCHVCGSTFAKATLPAHQRNCVKKRVQTNDRYGRSGLASSAAANGRTSVYPCTNCMERIPHHKLSEHLRTCRGTQARSATAYEYTRKPINTETESYDYRQQSNVSPSRDTVLKRTNQALQRHLEQEAHMPGLRARDDQSAGFASDENYGATFSSHYSVAGSRAAAAAERPQSSSNRFVPKRSVNQSNMAQIAPSGQREQDYRDARHQPERAGNSHAQNNGLDFDPSGDSLPNASWAAGSPVDQTDAYFFEDDQIEVPADSERMPCPTCGRKFIEKSRLEKHMSACAKSQRPRKTFDASKARVKGTELEKYAVRSKTEMGGTGKNAKVFTHENAPIPAQKNNWRVKREKFIQMIRAAREPPEVVKPGKNRKGGAASSQRPTRPVVVASEPDPDLIQCEYCSRRFNSDTAERHIPFCRDAKQKVQHRANGRHKKATGPASPSKEDMLKKRTAYKPPLPNSKSRSSPVKS